MTPVFGEQAALIRASAGDDISVTKRPLVAVGQHFDEEFRRAIFETNSFPLSLGGVAFTT